MTLLSFALAALVLLLGACALAGCGGSGRATTPASRPGDARPRLRAERRPRGHVPGDRSAATTGAGVRCASSAPSSSTDAVKLLRAGRADMAYLDIHDLAIADEKQPGSLVGVMALVQRPLAAVLAAPASRRPRDLEGRRAGVSGLPSDEAVLRVDRRAATAATRSGCAGDDRLPGGRRRCWPAASPRRPASGTPRASRCSARRPATRVFRVDDFGAPSYPELVLVTTPATLRRRRAVVTGDGRRAAPRLRGDACASPAPRSPR